MTATAVNPVLYSWMNHAFRREFIKVLPFLSWIFQNSEFKSDYSTTVLNPLQKRRVLTDCAPAANRVNCSDAVQDRRLTLNSNMTARFSIISTQSNGSKRNIKFSTTTLPFLTKKHKNKVELRTLINGQNTIENLKSSKKYSAPANCSNCNNFS